MANRRDEITEQLWNAATGVGFFQLSHHGIPLAQVREAFALSERFFALPRETKAQWPIARNAGWESLSQVRPSTGVPDQKESYQMTRPRMAGLYPSEAELPGLGDAVGELGDDYVPVDRPGGGVLGEVGLD